MTRTLALFLTITCMVALPWASQAIGDGPDEKPTARRHKGKFTIGKDTTYVTGPLDKDGYVDYAAAVNERLGKGVTPANNAIVLLWKALGPQADESTIPADYFRLLGIEAPAGKGNYFMPLSRYLLEKLQIDLEDQGSVEEELWQAKQRPWTPKDHPNLAAWLRANERPLAVAIEATKRSRYFSPIVYRQDSSDLISTVMTPTIQGCQGMVQALAARAMLRVGQGAIEDAWQDLLACHRLGHLLGQGPTLVDTLFSYSSATNAYSGEVAFLNHAKLDAKQIRKCLHDLQNLPPLIAPVEKVDFYERLQFVDCIMMIDRSGVKHLEALIANGVKPNNPLDKDTAEKMNARIISNIDWDPALQNANRWFDRMAAAMRSADRVSRNKQFDQLEVDLRLLRAKLADQDDMYRRFLGDSRTRGELIGDILIKSFLPSARKLIPASERVGQVQNNTILAFALAWYQREHGHYPKDLAELAPKYLANIPLDIFSGKPLIYRRNKYGYLLYSVGVNGKDDGGRTYGDDPPGDDLTIRVPLPELRRK